jgi:hypothetical protein
VGRSTTGRSSGVSLRSTYTSPVVPEGMAGDARVGPGRRLPGSETARRHHRSPGDGALRAGLVGEPTSVPEVGPCSSCLDQRPGAVHADPVSRALVGWRLPNRMFLGSSWGAPVDRPVPRCPWPPASRRLGASKRWPLRSPPRLPGARRFGAAPPLAAPVARCSSLRSVASRPARSRLRLVNWGRFPLRSARRLRSEDSVVQSRLACAPRYDAYLRERITPGQGVFLNPQGYPRSFSPIPRILRFVHRSCTEMSPDGRPWRSAFVDAGAALRLNGRRWQRTSPRSRLRRARGGPTCSSSRPRAVFLLPVS